MATQALKYQNKTVNHLFKKWTIYLTTFCLMWSNISWAGKDIIDDSDGLHPIARVRPSNYQSSGIDEVLLYSDGNFTLKNNMSGDVFNSPYAHSNIQKALSSGTCNLQKFVASHSFMVKGDAHNGYDISYTPKALGGVKLTDQSKLTLEIRPLSTNPTTSVSIGPFLGGGHHAIIDDHWLMLNVMIPTQQEAAIKKNISSALDTAISKKLKHTVGLTEADKADVLQYARDICKNPEDTTSQTIIENACQRIQSQKLAKTQMSMAISDVTTKYSPSLLSNLSKKGVSADFFSLWQTNEGKQFGNMSHIEYGYNIESTPSLVNKKTRLSYPIFIDDRANTNAFLPSGYKSSYQSDKSLGDFLVRRYENNTLALMDHIVGVANDSHNPLRTAFQKDKGDLNVRLTLGYGSINSYNNLTLRNTYKKLIDSSDPNKQMLGKILRDLDGCLYNAGNPQPGLLGGFLNKSDVPSHMMNAIEDMKSFIGRDSNGKIDLTKSRHVVRNINGHIGMENPYLKNGIVYPLFKEERLVEGSLLPKGFVDKDNYFKTFGVALTNAVGKGVKEVWCNTIGVCDVEAVPLALPLAGSSVGAVAEQIGLSALTGVGITYLGNKAYEYSEKATSALGFAFKNMMDNGTLPQEYIVSGGAKILVGIINDSIKIAQTLKTPIFEGTPLELLVTDGVIGKPNINVTPVHGGQKVALTTPIFDNWKEKERIIHMKITDDDIKFAERAKETHGLGEIRPSKNGGGVKWDNDPGGKPNKVSNEIRLMNGKGEKAPFPAQKDDYVKIIRGGKMLDVKGDEVKPGDDGFKYPKNNPRSHINKETWKKWKHPLHPTDLSGGK